MCIYILVLKDNDARFALSLKKKGVVDLDYKSDHGRSLATCKTLFDSGRFI